MNRALFLTLGVTAIVCLTAVSAQAAALPMAYDNSASTVLADWTMEGDGNPTVGTATLEPVGTSVVTASDEGISAYQGLKVLKSYRNSVVTTNGTIAFGSTPGSSDAITLKTAFYLKSAAGDALSILQFEPGTSATADGDVANYLFSESGAVSWYNNAGWQTSSQTCLADAWNTLVLTHTNGTGNWTMSVNGATPESQVIPNAGNGGVPNYLGILAAVRYNNGADVDSTFYIDAVPEPTTLGILVSGLIGLLAYAWRKRR